LDPVEIAERACYYPARSNGRFGSLLHGGPAQASRSRLPASRPVMQLISGLEIELTRFVKSPPPLFAKEGGFLPLKKGG
jgi:hypothetical protein